MQHKQLQAATVTTDQDQGTFTALVSAWTVDREQDTISRAAFDKTIRAWQDSGKNLPLLFEHSTTVVGAIDPHSMHPTEQGLVVAGEVDRSTEKAQQVWRAIKANTAGFSIGFMSESRPRKGGGHTITEIDLLEITATSKPMHPATRALSWKNADDRPDYEPSAIEIETHEAIAEAWAKALDQPPSMAELKARAKRLGVDELVRKSQPIQVRSFEVE